VDDLISEKEQIEQIRAWWSEYGGYVIGGLGLGIALLVGWNYWQSSKLEAQLASSALYETITNDVVEGNLEEAEIAAGDLAANYPNTAYAAQAQLALARLYMDKNRDQDAAESLQAVLDSPADDALKGVARARLARILLYQGEAQQVVDLLEGQANGAFAAIYNELLGDAYEALGRHEDARAAYEAVLVDPVAQATVDQQLVQWKALDLPEAADGTATESPDEEPAEVPGDEPAAESADEAAENAADGESSE